MPGAAHPATGQHTWEGAVLSWGPPQEFLSKNPCPSTPWPFHTAQETPPTDEELEAQGGAKLAWGLEVGAGVSYGKGATPFDGAEANPTSGSPIPPIPCAPGPLTFH